MKWIKSVLVTSVVLMIALGSAGANNKNVINVASGASSTGVSFGKMTQAFAIFPHSADVSVETYIGTTNLDSFVVKSGKSAFFYSPCDSIYIIRTTATGLTVNPVFDYRITPDLGGAETVDLRNPVPVTVSENNIFTGLNMESGVQGSATNLNMLAGGNAYRTFPAAGAPDVHGAQAMYLVLDWTGWKKGYFKIEHKFGASANDTLFNYYNGDGWAFNDSIVVNDSTAVGALTGMADGAGTMVIRIPYESVPGAGYYYCKITAMDKVHTNWVVGLNGTLVVVQ